MIHHSPVLQAIYNFKGEEREKEEEEGGGGGIVSSGCKRQRLLLLLLGGGIKDGLVCLCLFWVVRERGLVRSP